MKARARRVAGQMNRLEQRYADEILAPKLQVGVILAYAFEAVTLKLGDDCRYTPDFMVIEQDETITFIECKGFWRDDAKVKIRVAAEKFPMFRFRAVKHVRDRWDWEYYGAKDAA